MDKVLIVLIIVIVWIFGIPFAAYYFSKYTSHHEETVKHASFEWPVHVVCFVVIKLTDFIPVNLGKFISKVRRERKP